MEQPFSMSVDNNVVTLKFDAANYGVEHVKAVSVGPVGDDNMTSVLMDHDVVIGVAVLGQQKAEISE